MHSSTDLLSLLIATLSLVVSVYSLSTTLRSRSLGLSLEILQLLMPSRARLNEALFSAALPPTNSEDRGAEDNHKLKLELEDLSTIYNQACYLYLERKLDQKVFFDLYSWDIRQFYEAAESFFASYGGDYPYLIRFYRTCIAAEEPDAGTTPSAGTKDRDTKAPWWRRCMRTVRSVFVPELLSDNPALTPEKQLQICQTEHSTLLSKEMGARSLLKWIFTIAAGTLFWRALQLSLASPADRDIFNLSGLVMLFSSITIFMCLKNMAPLFLSNCISFIAWLFDGLLFPLLLYVLSWLLPDQSALCYSTVAVLTGGFLVRLYHSLRVEGSFSLRPLTWRRYAKAMGCPYQPYSTEQLIASALAAGSADSLLPLQKLLRDRHFNLHSAYLAIAETAVLCVFSAAALIVMQLSSSPQLPSPQP